MNNHKILIDSQFERLWYFIFFVVYFFFSKRRKRKNKLKCKRFFLEAIGIINLVMKHISTFLKEKYLIIKVQDVDKMFILSTRCIGPNNT
jgi:hypothetical protein